MTATDELRKLLDERGVKWKSGNFIQPDAETQWGNNRYTDYPELPPFLTISNCTPEQAIAATLGSGTCEYCKDGKFDKQTWMMSNHGWQRINYCPNCGARVERRDA